MNWKRSLLIAGSALICLSLLGGLAVAGKKKATTVTFFSGSPKVNKSGAVTIKGDLKTAPACAAGRSMKLFQTDVNGAVVATLDGATSDTNGNWKLQGKLPTPPSVAVPQYIQVKAAKRTVKKLVCRAGFSPIITVTAATG